MEPDASAAHSSDEDRAKRIEDLKAKYRAGELLVDEKALASRLIDSHIEQAADQPVKP